MKKIILATALLTGATCMAHAQNRAAAPASLDGVYTGQAGQWDLKLTVKGNKGDLTMSCSNGYFPGLSIKVGTDGTVDEYVTTGNGRRRLTGNVNNIIVVPPGGSCGGGTATMRKS